MEELLFRRGHVMCPMQERKGDIFDLTEGEDLAPRQETCPMEGKEKEDEEKLA